MKGPKDKKSPATLVMPGVDVEQLEKLLDFMAAHGLEEFEYEHGGLHIRLRKGSSNAVAAGRAQDSRGVAHTSTHDPAPAPVAPPPPAEPAAAPAENLHIIKSPIVGTFYAAASPEAAAFVRTGDAVREGQVVCIVEAMKLMNEIEADVEGEIVQVLVENGQPVEYGQSLFSVRSTKKKK